MNNTLKAADDVKKLQRMFAALGEVVEVLDRVGSLEQAENETQARVDRLNADALEYSRRIDEATAEAARIIESANQQAAEIRLAIERERAESSSYAESLKTCAREEAAYMTEQARSQVAHATAQAAQAAEAVKQAEDELCALNKKIDEARGQIARLLGT